MRSAEIARALGWQPLALSWQTAASRHAGAGSHLVCLAASGGDEAAADAKHALVPRNACRQYKRGQQQVAPLSWGIRRAHTREVAAPATASHCNCPAPADSTLNSVTQYVKHMAATHCCSCTAGRPGSGAGPPQTPRHQSPAGQQGRAKLVIQPGRRAGRQAGSQPAGQPGRQAARQAGKSGPRGRARKMEAAGPALPECQCKHPPSQQLTRQHSVCRCPLTFFHFHTTWFWFCFTLT